MTLCVELDSPNEYMSTLMVNWCSPTPARWGWKAKRKASTYRSGRSPDWIKSNNPACEAVRREEEEDWGRV